MPKEPFPEHVRGLLRKRAYPRPVRSIELVQTHISYVFLGDDEVYKLKKAVDLGFVDFTTLAKRRAACEAEVRLNRRGCPGGVYLGGEPLTRAGGRRPGARRAPPLVAPPPRPGGFCIYDCIDSNAASRYGDPGLDAAFLAMD